MNLHTTKKPQVTFIVAGLHRYREKFHLLNKKNLAEYGIDYELLVSPPKSTEAAKNDQCIIPWQKRLTDFRIRLFGTELIFQRIPWRVLRSDLIIVIQENSYLLNYFLIAARLFFGYKLAFFGHGRNYQTKRKKSVREIWKKYWLRKCDWWFTYTDGTAENIKRAGFPAEKITIFQNSTDSESLRKAIAETSKNDIKTLKEKLGINSDNIGIFIGGFYEDKRLEFLIDASIIVRQRIPDFILVMCGDGPDFEKIRLRAAGHDWIKLTGAVFSAEKAILLKMSKMMLMPGLVGLAVIDSLTAGIPLITTNIEYHSPEIDYLKESGAGIITDNPEDLNEYAQCVTDLIYNASMLDLIKSNAMTASTHYSIENMSRYFCMGVIGTQKMSDKKINS